MRTTVTLDDDLIADASAYSGLDDKSKLINLALTDYVRRMAAKRLAALGGSMPDLVVPARNSLRVADDSSPAREAARSLVDMGGTMPDLESPLRRRDQDSDRYQSMVADDVVQYKLKKPEDEAP